MKKTMYSVASLVLAALAGPVAEAQTSVLTQDYDLNRSGANLTETILTTANVASGTFGKLFSYPVDEEVFAQPLYMPHVSIAGGTHNVVFIATMGNSVYAFDADNPATAATPLWSVNLGPPIPSSKFLFFSGSGLSHSGIYSTPVIDPTSNTLYVVTHLWNSAAQTDSLQLHALGVGNGLEKSGSPVTLSAPGVNADVSEQRAALMLLNGTVYIPIASHADFRTNLKTLGKVPYVGMVLAYDAGTLAFESSFNGDAGGTGAAIWQGGRGLVSDGTYVYAMTANAIVPGTPDYSQSFVQLNPVTLSVAGYYQDPDVACINALDLDLAAAGPQLIPGAGTTLLVGGGKEGKVYTLQLDQALHTQTPAYFWGTSNHPTLPAEGGSCVDPRKASDGWLQGSDSAFWNNPSGASYFYTFGNADDLMSWQVSGNTFTQTSVDTPANLSLNALALSANGGTNGILWTVTNQTTGVAILTAYNAVPSGGHLTELWSSAQVPKRDAFGAQGRYSVPTIANGKVYVGSGSNLVAAYGLLPTAPAVLATPNLATLTASDLGLKSDGISVNALGGYTGTVALTLTGLPAGMTYSFSPASVTLTAKKTTVASTLTINAAGATLPLADNYTVNVVAAGTGVSTNYAPIRLLMRSASYTSVTRVGCNGSNLMDANLAWQVNGSDSPSIWIQDPTTPAFPGRLLTGSLPDTGSEQTGYVIGNTKGYLYWLIDQSAGAAASFDNALKYTNLGLLYKCP